VDGSIEYEVFAQDRRRRRRADRGRRPGVEPPPRPEPAVRRGAAGGDLRPVRVRLRGVLDRRGVRRGQRREAGDLGAWLRRAGVPALRPRERGRRDVEAVATAVGTQQRQRRRDGARPAQLPHRS
jgi:hypothetical protein